MKEKNNRIYRMRWRFEFFTNKKPKYGMWDDSGPELDLKTKAWCVNKEYLAFAIVEGKHLVTREHKVLFECAGPDYVNFAWQALAKVRLGGGGTYVPPTKLMGLTLTSRDHITAVYPSGEVMRRIRPEHDKKIQYAGFGK